MAYKSPSSRQPTTTMEPEAPCAEQPVFGTAYNVAGPAVMDAPGLHCSAYPNEFCFFCEYESNTDSSMNETDLYSSLADIVTSQGKKKREPSAIARHVKDAYDETVRMHVDGQKEWSLAAITRHIMYGGQFEDVFDTSVGNMLEALVARHNASLVDKSTNMVIEDHRKAFCDTVHTLIRWRKMHAK